MISRTLGRTSKLLDVRLALVFSVTCLASIGLSSVVPHLWEYIKVAYEYSASPLNRELVVRNAGHLVLDPDTQVREIAYVANPGPIALSLDMADSALKAIPGVQHAYVALADILFAGSGEPIRALHISSGYLEAYDVSVDYGRGLIDSDYAPDARSILVSREFIRTLDRGMRVLGEPIEIVNPRDGRAAEYVVVGIVAMPEVDVILPFPNYATFATPHSVPELKLMADRRSDLHALRASALEHFERIFGNGLVTVVKSEHPSLLTGEQKVVSVSLMVLGAITVSISLLSVLQVSLMLVGSRLKEIAVRVSLGARPLSVVRGIMFRLMVPSVLGAIVGAAIAKRLVDSYLRTLDSLGAIASYLNQLPFSTEVAPYVASVLGIILVAALGSLVPARRAILIPPAAVLSARRNEEGGPAPRLLHARLETILASGQYALAAMAIALGLALFGVGHFGPHPVWLVSGTKQPLRAFPLFEDAHLQPLLNGANDVSSAALVDQNNYSTALVVTPDQRTFLVRQAIRVTPSYFGLAPLRLTEGRFFTDNDRRAAYNTAVISSALASAVYGNESPIGETIRVQPATDFSNKELEVRIVGTFEFSPRRTGTMKNFYDIAPSIVYPSWVDSTTTPRFTHVLAMPRRGARTSSASEQLLHAARTMFEGARIPMVRSLDDFFYTEEVKAGDATDPNRLALLPAVFLPVSLAILNLLATQLMLVNSQQRDSTIRQALGARVIDIWWHVSGPRVPVLVATSALGSLAALLLAKYIARIDSQSEIVSLEIDVGLLPGALSTATTIAGALGATAVLIVLLTSRWVVPGRDGQQ